MVTKSLAPKDSPKDPALFYAPTFIPHLYRYQDKDNLFKKVKLISAWLNKESYKQSLTAYEEAEANCNTCVDLKRGTAPVCQGGFLRGTCRMSNAAVKFCPEDPMHMRCWKSRREDPYKALAKQLFGVDVHKGDALRDEAKALHLAKASNLEGACLIRIEDEDGNHLNA
jgi:hypothetical protein